MNRIDDVTEKRSSRATAIVRVLVGALMVAAAWAVVAPASADAQAAPCSGTRAEPKPVYFRQFVGEAKTWGTMITFRNGKCDVIINVNIGDQFDVFGTDGANHYVVQHRRTSRWGYVAQSTVARAVEGRSTFSGDSGRGVFDPGPRPTETKKRRDAAAEASQSTNTSSPQVTGSVTCSWKQPDSYLPNYQQTATRDYRVTPRNHHTCKAISTLRRGDQVTVHSRLGDFLFIENRTQKKWGWVHKVAFQGSSTAPTTSNTSSNNCAWRQPTSYVSNYAATGRTTYFMRPQPNSNCPTEKRIYANDKVTVHAHSGDWRFIENHTRKSWGWVHKGGFR